MKDILPVEKKPKFDYLKFVENSVYKEEFEAFVLGMRYQAKFYNGKERKRSIKSRKRIARIFVKFKCIPVPGASKRIVEGL